MIKYNIKHIKSFGEVKVTNSFIMSLLMDGDITLEPKSRFKVRCGGILGKCNI